MAIAYASHQYAEGSAGTTLTITKPTSLAVGDLMLAVLSVGNTTAWTTLSGWTAVGSTVISSNFPTRMNLMAKIADSGDTAASNFTFTGGASGEPKMGVIYRITGNFAGSSTPTDFMVVDTDNSVTPSGGTVTFPGGVTPLAASALLVFAITCGESPGADAPQFSSHAVANSNPTWTEDVDEGLQVGAFMNMGTAHATFSVATTTGAYSVASGRTSVHGGALVAINETTNGSVTLDVASMTATPQAPTVTGGASVTLDVASVTATAQTMTAAATAAKWVNTDKSSAGAITNTDKS